MARLGSGVPLVARGPEIAGLRAGLDAARDATPGVILIAGDAGVGKSRLLHEFSELARAADVQVLAGRCLAFGEAGLPYLPFMEIVEQIRLTDPALVDDRSPLAALTRAGRLSSAAPATESYDLGQLQLFDAVLGALVDLSSRAPVVVTIEDLHWSDPSTRDLLSFLVSRLSAERLLLVTTYRTDDLHRKHPLRPLLAEFARMPPVERIDLAPFAAAEAQAFVRAVSDDSLDESVVSEVAARSEGNAFFAEELLAAHTPGSGIPTALADVLLSRVEQLAPIAQRVVGAVSVTGRHDVSHAAVREVLGLDDAELDAALREAVQHHILVASGDTYSFRHALLQEAIYADLLPGERVRLHAAYAALITATGDDTFAAALAHHSLNSNDLPTALKASVAAGQDAMRIGALGAELRHVEQALTLWNAVDDPEALSGIAEWELLRKAAYVADAAGQPERATSYARAAVPAVDALGDPVRSADVRRQLAQIQVASGDLDDAVALVAQAWALVESLPASDVRAWVLALQARTTFDPHEKRRLAEAAIRDAREAGCDSAEADALTSLALSDTREGKIEEACVLLERAAELGAAGGEYDAELRAWFNLTINRYEQGRLDVAAVIADDAIRRADEVGLTWSPYGRELRWIAAMVHHARGDWDSAAAVAAPPGEQVSDTVSALLAASSALVQVGRGQFTEAERGLDRIRPEWYRDDQIAQLAGVVGTELACWRGDPEAAIAAADEAIDWIRKASSSSWPLGGIRLAVLALSAEADLARAARQDGDSSAEASAVEAGERYADYAEETARRGTPRGAELGPEGRAWVARIDAERARLRGEADPAAWEAVIDAFGHGEVYPQAHARWRLAEALITLDRRDDATAELAAALTTAMALGAVPLADAVRVLARRARLAVPGVTVASTDTLTPRELAVLSLVAKGYTNRRVGEELFISDKTVSVHVSRVMAKLGATGRTEAVAIALQRGLIAS